MIFKKFPIEYQMDSHDCGPACLKMVAKYFGKYYSLQYLRDKCGLTNQGISLLDLSTGAENIGLHALALKCRIDDIVTRVPFPAIVFWNENHFVVVHHADKRHLYVADPTKGRIRYTLEEFRRGWYLKEKITACCWHWNPQPTSATQRLKKN